MLDRPIVAFDIETIPDPDVGRRVLGLVGDEHAVVHEMVRLRLLETNERSEYPQLPFHRVVTIGVACLDPESSSFRLAVLGGKAMEERSHLEGFFSMFREDDRGPRLVSWNGNSFDLPVIRYRSMLHSISAPDFYRTDGEWKWNNYQNRFHDMHVDLMDVLSGYGASHHVGLKRMCELFGIPGKAFLTEPIYDHILGGKDSIVEEYCKLDCLDTLLVFLKWLTHTGQLSSEGLRAYVEVIRRGLEQEDTEGWAEILEGLREWPK